MTILSAYLGVTAIVAAAPLNCVIDEDFRKGMTAGVRLQDKGEFTPDGWKVLTGQTQIKWDLGRFYRKGRVEFEIRGPLKQMPKHSLFSAWNEEAAADGDRKTQGFYQVRVLENGMMLRLSYRPGGRSYEGKTGPLEWDDQRWYTVAGSWDTTGGENAMWRDARQLQQGKFNSAFDGFRWIFIGKDNYQKFFSIPGVTYRRLKVCVEP